MSEICCCVVSSLGIRKRTPPKKKKRSSQPWYIYIYIRINGRLGSRFPTCHACLVFSGAFFLEVSNDRIPRWGSKKSLRERFGWGNLPSLNLGPKKTWAKRGEQIYKSPHIFGRCKHQKKRSKIQPLLEIDCNFIRKWFWTLVLFHQVTTKVFLRGLFILSAADARENPGGRGGYHQTLPLLADFFGCGLGEWQAFLTTGRSEKMAKKTKYE